MFTITGVFPIAYFINLFQVPCDEFCCIPELPNLKHFDLPGNIRPTPFLRVADAFLKACPALYKLTVKEEDVTYKHK